MGVYKESNNLKYISNGDAVLTELTKTVRLSLDQHNWYAAIIVSLTLPDICAKVDGRFGKTTAARYPAWYERYVVERNKPPTTLSEYDFFSPKDCYALRCAFLHEGSMDINSQPAHEYVNAFSFKLSDDMRWVISNSETKATIHLNLKQFCEDICNGVEAWVIETEGEEEIAKMLSKLPRIDI